MNRAWTRGNCFEDKVGTRLHPALVAAANRGVRVELTVDGYGSPDLSPDFVSALVNAGARLRVFDPKPRSLGIRTIRFRRMHRKIVVVDERFAFVGGINFSADHLTDFGAGTKQDYSVEIESPAVAKIRAFAIAALDRPAAPGDWMPPAAADRPRAGNAQVRCVTRDNARHLSDIEQQYVTAICAATDEVRHLPAWAVLRPAHVPHIALAQPGADPEAAPEPGQGRPQ